MGAIIVLGMHRSGTSCLTGIMQRFGVHLGDVFTENPHNRRGNREHPRIMALNDAVLAENGGAWDRPVEVRRWSPQLAEERDAIIALLQSEEGEWGFKDPRSLLTLPFWLPALPDPRFVGTFRHPLRVALSLQRRNGWPLEQGVSLWCEYNRRLLAYRDELGFALVDFDLPQERYLEDVVAKLVTLGLDQGRTQVARDFFDLELRHQTAIGVDDIPLAPEALALYRALCRTNG